MFKRPTVFVLGAGASFEVGMPLGETLKAQIGAAVDFRFDAYKVVNGRPQLFNLIREKCGHDQIAEQQVYVDAGKDLAATVGTFQSIDEALHYWSSRPEIIELGKVAVAYEILEAENNSRLRIKDGRIDISAADTTWMWQFFQMALAGATREDVPHIFREVTIINFNYDRTLEHYLYLALQQRQLVKPNVAAEAVTNLRVIRPYGSVGKLDWQGKDGLGFGHGAQDFFSVARQIRTFTEQTEKAVYDGDINATLANAELILFLGFGFHAQNIDLLAGADRHLGPQKAVYATAIGVDEENHYPVADRLRTRLSLPTDVRMINRRCNELLSSLRPTLTLIVGT